MFYWPRSLHRFSSVKLVCKQAPREGRGGGGEKEGLLAAESFSRLTLSFAEHVFELRPCNVRLA